MPSAEAALGQQREKSVGVAEKLMLKDNREGSAEASEPGWVGVAGLVLRSQGPLLGGMWESWRRLRWCCVQS